MNAKEHDPEYWRKLYESERQKSERAEKHIQSLKEQLLIATTKWTKKRSIYDRVL